MNSSSSSSNDSLADEWISFEDFCQGVDSFLAPKSPSSGGEEDMLPQGKGYNFKLGHVVEVPYLVWTLLVLLKTIMCFRPKVL